MWNNPKSSPGQASCSHFAIIASWTRDGYKTFTCLDDMNRNRILFVLLKGNTMVSQN